MDVKRGPILFRCDATPETGYESFHQSLSLAAAMQRRRRGTHFLSYLEPLSLAQTIHRENNEWTPAESLQSGPGDRETTLREVRRLGAAAVVFAGPNIDPEVVRAVRDLGADALALDPETGRTLPATVIVNPFLAPARKLHKVETGTHLLHGRKFALVRGVFRRQRTIRATEQPGPFRALVAFGDDDAGDQTIARTEQLLEMGRIEKVSILLRQHHARYHDIKDFADESGGKVEIVTETKDLMTRLVRAHLALTSGDSTSMELCCVGIPQLTLPVTPLHLMNAKRLDDEGAATFVGDGRTVDFGQLAEAVGIVLDDPMERLGMSRCARNLIDGRGGDRIVNGLEIVLHSPRRRDVVRFPRIAA